MTLKGQVTIPKAIRTALSIHDGDSVFFTIAGDQAILRQLKKKPLPELYAALPATRPYPGLEAVRREVRQKRAHRFEKRNRAAPQGPLTAHSHHDGCGRRVLRRP